MGFSYAIVVFCQSIMKSMFNVAQVETPALPLQSLNNITDVTVCNVVGYYSGGSSGWTHPWTNFYGQYYHMSHICKYI